MPLGERLRSSASRSAPSLLAAPARRARGAAVRLRIVADLRLAFAFAELPATPCVILRCAPSAAARVNVLPHSGQVSVVGVFLGVVAGAVAIGCLLVRRRT